MKLMKNNIFITGIFFMLCLFALLAYQNSRTSGDSSEDKSIPVDELRTISPSQNIVTNRPKRPATTYTDNENKDIPIKYGSTIKKCGKLEKFTYTVTVNTAENINDRGQTTQKKESGKTSQQEDPGISDGQKDPGQAAKQNAFSENTDTLQQNASEKIKKSAYVYLPYGYDENDAETKYDILYLMHGGGDNESWYFGDIRYKSDLQLLLDHMIANKDIKPCIVCACTYQNPLYDNESACVFHFDQELREDLIPSLETKYHTYYNNNAISSRWHRAFCGFSMGAATTWQVFAMCLDEVAYFMPISGRCFGDGSDPAASVEYLVKSVEGLEYTADDFLIYYGCGGKRDLAHDAVKEQVAMMKKENSIFRYTHNFSSGNFYYHQVKGGYHDITTVYKVLYNGLPKFFGY